MSRGGCKSLRESGSGIGRDSSTEACAGYEYKAGTKGGSRGLGGCKVQGGRGQLHRGLTWAGAWDEQYPGRVQEPKGQGHGRVKEPGMVQEPGTPRG